MLCSCSTHCKRWGPAGVSLPRLLDGRAQRTTIFSLCHTANDNPFQTGSSLGKHGFHIAALLLYVTSTMNSKDDEDHLRYLFEFKRLKYHYYNFFLIPFSFIQNNLFCIKTFKSVISPKSTFWCQTRWLIYEALKSKDFLSFVCLHVLKSYWSVVERTYGLKGHQRNKTITGRWKWENKTKIKGSR